MSSCCLLPEDLRQFVASCSWVFAKTYAATWPHEYIVREKVDEGLFVALVEHIRAHGYGGKFYAKPITYFDEAGMVYWTMGAPVEETIIVNRCTRVQTYAYRLEHGTLPEPVRTAVRGGRQPNSSRRRVIMALIFERPDAAS